MRKTPFGNFMVFPFAGIVCIAIFFVTHVIDNAPVRKFKADLNRETEKEKAVITNERALLDHRLETGVIEPFSQLIMSGYTDTGDYPPGVNFNSIDPAIKTLIYDQYGICVGFTKGNRFFWKYTGGQLDPDVCRGVAPVETVQTMRRDREQQQQGEFNE